jgi:hypothetical protein
MATRIRRLTEEEREAGIPRLSWDQHIESLEWNPGEHVILIGPTGRGKTVLWRELIRYREARDAHVLIVATKARDSSLSGLAPGGIITKRKLEKHERGYLLTRSWDKAVRIDHPRVLLWVKYRGPQSVIRQRAEAERALATIFAEGGWTVVLDELRWFVDRLKLENWVIDLYLQGRSLGVTAMAGTQRPRHVPLEVYSNSMHLYIWGTKDQNDLKRLGGLGGLDDRVVKNAVGSITGHDVLYIDALRERMHITRAPSPR